MGLLTSLSAFASSLLSTNSNLENVGQVLETKAVPGLMTVLDVALQQSVEMELTATLTTSHALLAALLDVKEQAKLVINLVRREGLDGVQQQQQQTSKVAVESFARACLDAACDIMQVLSTDKLAETANLSDPYGHLNAGGAGNGGAGNSSGGSSHQTSIHSTADAPTPELPTSPLSETVLAAAGATPNPASSVNLDPLSTHSTSSNTQSKRNKSVGGKPSTEGGGDDWWKALKDSVHDTGRRIPMAQRRSDLWETARLQCVDFVWADELIQYCQRILRHLVKHPVVSEVNNFQAQMQNHHPHQYARGTVCSPTLASFSNASQEEISILLQLVQVDVPVRVLQFRAAVEHESVLLKRLYLLKCEYRAPFRAFLEAHQSVFRAPSVKMVQAYETSKAQNEERKRKAKERLQKLLETPALVDCLTLEQTSQHLEIEISKALYPFCELARYLDHKKALLRYSDTTTVLELQILLHRLKGLLTRKASGHDTSAGIRPLLLDLQKVPREDEIETGSGSMIITVETWESQVECLIHQLKLLNQLCCTRGSFRSDKKADVEAPAVVVERCARFDEELFRCHCVDWYTVVEQQQNTKQDWDVLAAEIRQAELELSLASIATTESLQLLAKRLRALEQDREKRFQVLAESLKDFGERELNLLIKLEAPDSGQVLCLRSTSAKGVFGLPLEMAGEILPIG